MDNEDEYLNTPKFLDSQKQYAEGVKSDLSKPFGENEQDDFLNAIQGVESNFGQNTNHQPLKNGLQAGTAAIGNYGLMPNTIKDVVGKIGNPGTRLGKYLTNQADYSDIKNAVDVPDDELKNTVESNPVLQNQLARLLAKDVALKNNNDPQRMSYSWNMGSNVNPNKVPDIQVRNNEYVQKFNKIRALLQKKVP